MEGSKEEFEKELGAVPCDKAQLLAPDIKLRFAHMASTVYPHLPTDSAQYKEMEMVWHVAYLDFLDVLANTVSEQEEDVGADMIEVIRIRTMEFLKEYQERRMNEKGQQQ